MLLFNWLFYDDIFMRQKPSQKGNEESIHFEVKNQNSLGRIVLIVFHLIIA